MSKLITNTIRHTGASSDNITLASDGSVTLPNDTVDIATLSATGTASSSTFLRGDNTWAEAGGGAFDLITTTTSSDTATTTQDGYFSSTYDTYKIIGYVSPEAQDKFNIRLQTGGSTNGSGTAGSSYTTASYAHASHRAYNATANNNQFSNANTNTGDWDNPADVIRPGFGAGADDHQEEATNTGTYMLWLFCPLQTDQWTRYFSEFIFAAASNYNRHVQEGYLKTTTAVTGFNCWYDSNNHSGKFRLYGLK